jgi:GT2 family glycosyltransferase
MTIVPVIDVSIIVVNYNTKQITANCLESIFRYTSGISFEIILVDNASTDGSVELFKKDDRIIFIENKENLGFAKSNNLGFKKTKGKYIFLLNSDTELLNNAVKIFYDNIERMLPNISCLGSILVNKNGYYSHSFGKYLSVKDLLSSLRYHFLFSSETMNFVDSQLEVQVIIGADLFIRRSTIEELSLFDPVFFMYNEENDLQRRFALNGYKSIIIDGPKIMHLEGSSSKYNKINYLRAQSNLTYMKKWNKNRIYMIYRILYTLIQLPKLLFPRIPWYYKIKLIKTLIFYRVPKSNISITG